MTNRFMWILMIAASFGAPSAAMAQGGAGVKSEPVLADPRHPDANIPSYIIMDIDGDGLKFGADTSKDATYWDIDDDGFAEATAWPHDAFLAVDLNGNGRIDGGEELFGIAGTDSFSLLRRLDDTHDGFLDENDGAWDKLLLWRDADRNGASRSSELTSLITAGVMSIRLDTHADRAVQDGNTILKRGLFNSKGPDGKPVPREMVTVLLKYDNLNVIDRRRVRENINTLILPNLRGYGVMTDLHKAMALDPKGLMARVKEISLQSLPSLVADPLGYEKRIDDIIFSWAGVYAMDPNSRGPNIDARRLAATERLTGEKFAQLGAGGRDNPLFFAAIELNHGYARFFNHFYSMIAAQIYAGQIFRGAIFYDLGRDALSGVQGLNIPALAEIAGLIGKNPDPALRRAAWRAIARLVRAVDNKTIPSEDTAALDVLIRKSDPLLSYDTVDKSIDMPDIRTLPGNSYATKALGLSEKDGDLTQVLKLARERDSSKQIVYSDLVTAILRDCCKSEQAIIDYLRAHRFTVGIYPMAAARKVTGSDMNFTHVLKAVWEPGPIDQMGSLAGSPPDFNIIFVYLNGDQLEWAYGHLQK